MRISSLLTVLMVSSVYAVANAAPLNCNVTGVAVQVRTEGLTEQLGDIVLSCTGGTPGATVSGNLSVSLPVAVTNRLSAGNVVDATLTVSTGTGPVSTGATPVLQGTNAVGFNGITFTLPADGGASLRISNLRAAVAQLGQSNTAPIQALLSWSGSSELAFDRAMPTVGVPHVGLLAGFASTMVSCQGSQLPPLIDVAGLMGTSAVSSVRVTEGFTSAFGPGVRFRLTYSGFPAGARLFAPDAIAGSDALQPTLSGLLGGGSSGGVYTGGSGTLFLLRVLNADPDGSGGTLATVPGLTGTATVALDGASEVPLAGGAGFAVYQVMDQNPLVGENAEIPTWLGLPPTGGATASPRQGVTFAPVSTVATATATDPVPRFVGVEPPADCSLLNDCASFPTLSIQPQPTPFEFTAAAGAKAFQRWVWVKNTGGGVLAWTAYLQFASGANWAALTPIPDLGVNVQFTPKNVVPGVYEATLTIDAGAAGIVNVPVKLTVTAPQPPPSAQTAPQVDSVVQAATLQPGVVPGSLATLLGSHLAGSSVSVTFGSSTASLLYAGEHQITLLVPQELAGHASATMTTTVKGVSSQQNVNLTDIAPGVFAILNQDSSLNSPGNDAEGGSIVQVFATGLPPAGIGTITAKIHDVWITSPAFAGPAPGFAGLQQVNLRVPAGWPRMDTSVILCGTSLATGARTCSPQAPLSVK
jgi:uncharacterized protein (TIGR03437 family)